ncbi:MAG: type II toxin-antitoxin system RelE/ParE family toxin [Leptolyngbyaceae bacterium]|nr:type II toxin-antitoxin system RelE/ParE family toxin [Leptolyngbyaceae bacterium]
MEIRRTEQADLDLIEIWVFIARHSIQDADRFIDRIEERYLLLLDYPHLGPEKPNLGEGVRVLVEGNYYIFYRVSDDLIEVLRIIRASRDIQALF